MAAWSVLRGIGHGLIEASMVRRMIRACWGGCSVVLSHALIEALVGHSLYVSHGGGAPWRCATASLTEREGHQGVKFIPRLSVMLRELCREYFTNPKFRSSVVSSHSLIEAAGLLTNLLSACSLRPWCRATVSLKRREQCADFV